MKQLKVILLGYDVGALEQSRDGRLSFAYSESWLASEWSRPLSQSLPLQSEPFSERECAPFFGGLLPEEHNREIVAKNLGITPRNDFAMLREIGGECAGAVSLLPVNEEPVTAKNRYEPVTESDLISILEQLPKRPLLAGRAEIRLSLAGAQNKVALRLEDNGYAIPLHESPSTHILKPEWERFPGLVDNEVYCLRLASSVGLSACKAEAKQFGPHRCLLVTRYDRVIAAGNIHRLHQEDFCQALGILSRIKYQNEGGPGLAQSFDLVRKTSSSPARDLLQLFNGVLFNYLIGNHDAHGKNFSLLYSALNEPMSVRLASFYDMISTACYPELTTRMAMKIGKTYESTELRQRDWELYWEAIGFSSKQARRQTLQFIENMTSLCQSPENDAEAKIQEIIIQRSNRLRALIH